MQKVNSYLCSWQLTCLLPAGSRVPCLGEIVAQRLAHKTAERKLSWIDL